jgi:hypothetical protein
VRRPLAASLAALVVVLASPACSSTDADAPPCGRPGNQWILAAQTVPSATFLPCVDELPTGWVVSAARFERGSYTAWFDSDRAGPRALELTLAPSCETSGAVQVPAVDVPPGVRVLEKPISLSPRFEADRYLTFDGGCITQRYRFASDAPATLALEVQQSLDVVARGVIRRALGRFGLDLCGAGAAPCPG